MIIILNAIDEQQQSLQKKKKKKKREVELERLTLEFSKMDGKSEKTD